MRNILKATTLENKFPLFTVENGCIVSKDADITVAFRVELPELFTVTAAEYEAIHSAWNKAVKVLPDYSIVHKQDWFIKENYVPDIQKDDLSFLSRSFERHFNERPFLNHTCYLFLTKTTKERSRMQSNFSTLCRGFLVPKEIRDRETVTKFLEAVGQFESIMNDSGFITLTRLNSDEITGTRETAGIVEKYFSLSQTDTTTLKDISLGADEMKIGDNILCLHTLSDAEDMPGKVGTDTRYEKLSTDRSDCRLSFASPVGVLLSCNHIYNQYIFIDDHTENLKQFEKMARNMHSLSKYSRANQINKSWIEEYLNEAHSQGLISVRCHCNIMAWSDDRDELKHIKNDVGSQLALMECKPRHNTTDTPTLFWAGIPGNQADFPVEESFYTFIEQALCLFTEETNYKSSLSPFGIKMVDRVTGKPLHIDISDLPMKIGIITNRNKFILGPSGSGKSFFTNHMVRQYYEQNAHVLLVDTGNSYLGLCEMINRKTHGEDGIYFTYTTENPIAFNPFYVVEVLDEQEYLNQKIAERVPVIAARSAQEQPKKAKRKGFLGLFGKKEKPEPTATTTMLHTLNRKEIATQQAQSQRLAAQVDSLATRNRELNRQLQSLIGQIDKKIQNELQSRETEITAMRERSFVQIGSLTGFLFLILVVSYIIIHRNTVRIKRYRRKTSNLIGQLQKSVEQNEALIASRKKAVHTITHELRTPLTAITGYAGLMEKENDMDKLEMYIQNIKQSSNRMREMLNTLLDFFRLDNGKEQPNFSPLPDFGNHTHS